MEARRLQTVDDLLTWPDDERVELIDGEIMKRPMARFEHGLVQSGLIEEVSPFKRRGGPSGWWIITEVSVQYNEHTTVPAMTWPDGAKSGCRRDRPAS